jgi:hypothetical protein
MAERGSGSPSASTYRRWISGEAVVPAWALQVAAEVAGTTLQALLDAEEGVGATPDDWRAQIEDAIGRLEGEMIEVRQRVGLPWQSQESDAAADQSPNVQDRASS